MKHVMLAIALLVGGVATAQEKTPPRKEIKESRPEDNATRLTARMTKELTLSSEQAAQVQTINMDAAKQRETIHKTEGITPEEKKTRIKAVEESRNAALKSVLTEEQHTKMIALVKAKADKRNAKKLEEHPQQKLKTTNQ